MLSHLAAPRVAAVQHFFHTKGETDLYGCYAWSQAVASGLLPILGDFEVSLRNAVHRSLSQYHGGVDSFEWMLKTRPNANAQGPALEWHKMKQKTHDEIEREHVKLRSQRKKGRVTPDDLVAKMSFGFWEKLLQSLTNSVHPAGLQAAVLRGAFPKAPVTATVTFGHQSFNAQLVALLARIREVRNRIGHHDQIWRVVEFDQRGSLGFTPRRPRHTVASLRLFSERIAWLAGWIDPAITSYMRSSDHWWSFHALLSQNAIATFRLSGGRVGTYETILREKLGNGQQRWKSVIPARAAQLNDRILKRQFHY